MLKDVHRRRLEAVLLAVAPSTNTRAAEFAVTHLLYLHERLVLVAAAGAATVDSRDLIAALCFFAGGSKSEKLAFCFELFADDGSSLLSRIGLLRLFRALLHTISALPELMNVHLATETLRWQVESAAAACVQAVFRGGGSGDTQRTHVDFLSFAQAYNDGVHTLLLWLEMLSPEKWPSPAVIDGHSPAPILLQYPLAPPDSSGLSPPLLRLTSTAVLRFVEMTQGLLELSYSTLLHSLELETGPDGGISEGGMLAALRNCGLFEGDGNVAATRRL